MDRLGFAEASMGEHHAGGVEIVSCPEIMVAAASDSGGAAVRCGESVQLLGEDRWFDEKGHMSPELMFEYAVPAVSW